VMVLQLVPGLPNQSTTQIQHSVGDGDGPWITLVPLARCLRRDSRFGTCLWAFPVSRSVQRRGVLWGGSVGNCWPSTSVHDWRFGRNVAIMMMVSMNMILRQTFRLMQLR
jgi:hypothetical protein